MSTNLLAFSRRYIHRIQSASLLLVLLLSTFSMHAAEVTATLSGTVKDSTGAVVSRASVIVTNTDTNAARSSMTLNDGSYQFTLLPIGTYRVTVEQTGFRKYVREGIVLNVNQNARLDVALQVGAASQVVEVTGDVTQVDTVSATLGNVETERRKILDALARGELSVKEATRRLGEIA